MTLRAIEIDWKNVKTFATKANLLKRLEEDKDMYPDFDDRFIIVRTPEGRWTAIVKPDFSKGGYCGRYPFLKV